MLIGLFISYPNNKLLRVLIIANLLYYHKYLFIVKAFLIHVSITTLEIS